jgi:hypothetical protein
MGELHLEIIVDRLKREFKVDANVGKPRVAYRETIRKTVEQEGKFVRQSGGRGQYGHVWLRLEPREPGGGYEFVNAIVGGVVPREYVPAVDKGVQEQMEKGVLAGYPVVDVKVTIFDGSYHEVDSSEMAFKIAGSMGFKDGAPQGGCGAAGADHEGRGGHPRGLHGRRDGRPQPPARHPAGHGRFAVGQGDPRRGAAGRDVRLCHRPALGHSGPRDLFHGIRQVQRSPRQYRGGGDQESILKRFAEDGC